jgi:acetylornithine deacetylase
MTDVTLTKAILADLIAYPTVSSDSNLALMDHMASVLETAGARVELLRDASGSKANLFATIGPDRAGGVLLSGHSDVVPVTDQPWDSDPFCLVEDQGRLYGRGACDMKGFIAATLAMAPHFAARPLIRPIHFAFTHDEEVGCLGARALIPALQARGIRPDSAIVGEPTNMRIIEAHKGCCEYTVIFEGLEGHGSEPDRGVNALEYAAAYVARLMELRDQLRLQAPVGSPFDPPWTTINIGRLMGGTVHNVIANRAELDWEMRPVQDNDADVIRQAMAAYCNDVLLPRMQAVCPDAAITTRVIGEVCGLEPRSENPARRLVTELTGANGADVASFGTEAGLYQKMGVSTVLCGPGSIEQAHRANEYVTLSQLDKCLSMLHGLGETLSYHDR